MDITFEDVAHVIQDARYQQAIFDTDIPKPDKKIPGPGKGFDFEAFIEEKKISLASVIEEPLGRFFLRSFVVKGTEEEKILNFTESMFNFRRRDPLGIVNALDIVALVDRFGVNISLGGGKMISSTSAGIAASTKKENDDSSNDTGNGVNVTVNEDDMSASSSGVYSSPPKKTNIARYRLPKWRW